MIIYDTTKGEMTVGGTAIDFMAEATALITLSFFQIAGQDGEQTQHMMKMFAGGLMKMACDPELIDRLRKDNETSTVINLSHIMRGGKQ